MKQVVPYIVVVIATLLIVWVLKPFDPGIDVKSYESKIEALEKKVDSLHAENDVLYKEADSLELKLQEFDIRIVTLNKQIKVIKYETKQKLDAVDFFGDDELERFFSDRYRQHTDSIN